MKISDTWLKRWGKIDLVDWADSLVGERQRGGAYFRSWPTHPDCGYLVLGELTCKPPRDGV